MTNRRFKIGGLAAVTMALLMTTSAELGARDRDNNPPGPAGGRGTNWENPPGAEGGHGASPDRRRHPKRHHWCKKHPKHASCKDRDNNPPGAVGGAGTNWENPPGPEGGRGASPN